MHKTDHNGHHDVHHSRMIGWEDGRHPFAHTSLHIGIYRGLPCGIQSFFRFFPGRRSNSAQSSIPNITPLGERGALCAS